MEKDHFLLGACFFPIYELTGKGSYVLSMLKLSDCVVPKRLSISLNTAEMHFLSQWCQPYKTTKSILFLFYHSLNKVFASRLLPKMSLRYNFIKNVMQ